MNFIFSSSVSRSIRRVRKVSTLLLGALVFAVPALAKAPFSEAGCQIHDEQGRCAVIVDFADSAANGYPSTYPPGYPSSYPPGSFFHRPQVVNLVYSYARQYGFKVGGMTSWAGISFTAYLFRDQVETLRDDPLVKLVTEDSYQSFSPGPPGQTFPPPFASGEVTEYVNYVDFPKQPGGQFFYAAMDMDRTLLDSVPTWRRTGRSFKTSGSQSVCRLYGGVNGGPNTHFYSLDKTECDLLRALPALTYEGQTFLATLPRAGAIGNKGTCPAGMVEIYRLYNNAYVGGVKNNWESNHRYVRSLQDVTSTVQLGWTNEGVAFCQPM
ncbi:MAG: hypothetical protein H7203_04965 [Rhizobacter sp.]|nr:hypothetical protein [Burkholderiales bacterium]